jgi:hypothetical protein
VTDEELVAKASRVVLDVLHGRATASPDELEQAAVSADSALDREVIGLAVLRLLRDGKLQLTDDYAFTVTGANAAALTA